MKLFFFFAHPAKFHLFRNTINRLKENGHEVDIMITGRPVLEELVKSAGWDYTMIFPKGRRISYLPTSVGAVINSIRTVFKLIKFTHGKKYDLFLTSDFLTIIGRIKGTPSLVFTDDDLKGAPNTWILYWSANYVVAPEICDIGKYNFKKLGYPGYKALGHLHPNWFKPDKSIISKYNLTPYDYVFIRTVSVTSHHDGGMIGIDNEVLTSLKAKITNGTRLVLNSERVLPEQFHPDQLDFSKEDLPHLIAFSKLVISDSTTLCAEAAALGIPVIEFNNWSHLYKQSGELNAYNLIYFTFDLNELLQKTDYFLASPNLVAIQQEKRNRMLADKIDVSSFFIWLIENYPNSVEILAKDKNMIFSFK